MPLTPTIEKVLASAEKLKGSKSGNEANTKALLIEPTLRALGWDLEDIDQVDREVPVYDGTKLDYALKIDGQPHLFLEAKGVKQNLDDKQFISQTINYANNQGISWCVLTNGLRYRVYKATEPVGMEEKLLFEVDLSSDKEGSLNQRVQTLEQLSREAISGGTLDARGEEVFTDKRVRDALASLAAKQSKPLIDAIGKELGQPPIAADHVGASLVRVVTGQEPDQVKTPKGGAKKGKSPADYIKKQEYPLDHHTGGKPAGIVDLFERLDEFARALGNDISRRSRKQYIAYFVGKRSFFTLELQKARIIVYLNLDPTNTKPWNDDAMRDVRKVGHFGMGDTEYSLTQSGQLADVQELVKQAYEGTRT